MSPPSSLNPNPPPPLLLQKKEATPSTDFYKVEKNTPFYLQLTILLLQIFLIVLAVWGGFKIWENIQIFPRTEDANISANSFGVSPQVGGTIISLNVVDNQEVKRGDLLLTLDARPYEAEAARAQARLKLVQLEVQGLRDQIEAAKASLREKEAQAAYATAHYDRLKPLLQGNFASIDKVQEAESAAASSVALVNEARATLTKAENDLGEVDGKNTRIEEAQASLRDAQLKASYCKVYAPCDGYVTNLQITPGAYAATGRELFTIVDNSIWYVLANFREIDIHRIRPGQNAIVYLMARNHKPVRGIVQGIARGVFPIIGASKGEAGEQGIISGTSPTFDFIQLATRFPVRIILQGEPEHDFRIGGRASVVIDTRTTPYIQELPLLQETYETPFIPPMKAPQVP